VRKKARTGLALVAGSALILTAAIVPSAARPRSEGHHPRTQHVLLISVDGMHQSDLKWFVHAHPDSNLAMLVRRGRGYTDAMTPVPSDSFPGMIAQVTGGNPGTTGVYYDDSYNHDLLPPSSSCTPGQTTGLGTEVPFAENLDVNTDRIDAGFGISNLYPGLPASVMALPGDVATIEHTMIDSSLLPIDPSNCGPVWPRQYLKVNTVFDVATQAGLRTAWSDKHPAYEILAGQNGLGIGDLFTPEINSSTTDPAIPPGAGPDWTKNNQNTQLYDSIKVQSVLNEIDGFDHSGMHAVGTPAIFGMNFQTVSTAEKLPLSPIGGVPRNGGYVRIGRRWVPGPVLKDALGFVDAQLGRMLSELRHQHLMDSTAVILSAKHAQSPIETSSLKRIDDGNVIDALNAAWVAHGGSGSLVAFAIDDDAMYIWLTDRSPSARRFATTFLLRYDQPASAHVATDYQGNPIGFSDSGLAKVLSGPAYFGVPSSDPRVPDLVGLVQHGVVYTGGTSKIAEHGGADPQDRHVPIVVFGAGVGRGSVDVGVHTTQIAPTILRLLGLDPNQLEAVATEHTKALPGI
jgi:hypothetical protein